MFRFIGGPARCGKSTLLQKASRQYDGELISLDNLRSSYLAIVSDEMRLQLKPNASIKDNTVDEWIDILRKRDRLLWDGAKGYLEAAAANHDDVMMEGCVWPDYADELTGEFRAVYVVDTSAEHVDRIIAAARNEATHNNWMKDRDEAWLRQWAEYNIERSKLYVELAKKYNQPVFDVGELGFEEAQARALRYLFES